MDSRAIESEGGDCWYGVTDPRKRKQIQDRLAQRARRKRLAQAKQKHGQGQEQEPNDQNCVVVRRQAPPSTTPSVTSDKSPAASSNGSGSSTNTGEPNTLTNIVLPIPVDQRMLPDAKITAIVALWINGNILGIPCDRTNVTVSSPPSDTVPKSLRPTALQMSVPHVDWIDRWPFPRMRDNMIVMSNVIDIDQIFQDFFLMRSFAVVEGADAWDPHSWHIFPEFNAKWGHLWY